MSTKFLSPGWRMPRNANQSKQSNYSMNFDAASSDYINFTGLPDFGGGSLTTSFWIKSGVDTTNAYVLMRSGFSFFIHQNGTSTNLRYRLQTSTQDSIYGGTILDNNWHHCVMIFDSSANEFKVFEDGNQVGSTVTTSGSLASSTSNVYLASFATGAPFKSGQFDGLSFFDYALSPSQVTTLWGGGTSVSNPMALPSPPIAYYPLGESAGGFVGGSGTWLTENNAIGDYVFDFVPNNYIDLGNNVFFNTNNPFSFSTWVNLDSYSDPYPYLANLKTNVTDGIGIFISNNSSYSGVNVGSTDSSITKGKTTGDISGTFLNSWNQVVVTYNGNGANTLSNFLIYVNGSPVTLTSTGTFGTMPNTANNIGRRSNSYHYLDGKISNVQIFNTSLSGTEVTTLYNYGSPIQTLANIPQNSNLKAWYKLDASEVYNSSTTEWSIDNNQNPSAYPSSLDFVSSESDYIDCGNNSSFDITSELTLSAWIKKSSTTSNQFYISKRSSSGDGYQISSFSNKAAGMSIWIGGSRKDLLGTTNHVQDVWYHVVGTYDGANMRVYLNGIEENSVAQTGAIDTTTAKLILGAYDGSGYSFDGKISNAQIFNTALPEIGSNSVETLYNNGTPLSDMSSFTSLVSWYKLNNTTTGIGNSLSPWTSSLNFDGGINNGITIQNDSSLEVSSQFTMSCWFKSETSQNSYAYPIYKASSNTAHAAYGIYLQNNVTLVSTAINTGSGVTILTSDSLGDLRDGKWHHVAQIYDGTQMKVYLDGNQSGSAKLATGTVSYSATYQDLYIGKTRHTSPSGYYSFKGEVSNVQLFNTALPATGSNSVQTIYNIGVPLSDMSSFSSLVSWWKLNNTTTGVQDSKGSNNGTNNGATESIGLVSTLNGTNNGATEYTGFVNTLVGDSLGMSQANLVQSDLQTVAPYSKYAIKFEAAGGNERIEGIGNTLGNGFSELSISAWVKYSSSPGNQYWPIIAKSSGNGTSFQLQNMRSGGSSNGGELYFNVQTQNGSFSTFSGVIPSTNVWYNVVGTYNGSEVKIYINNSLKGTLPATGIINTNNSQVWIGDSGYGGYSSLFQGVMSNISVWNTGLTSSQVTEIYNQGLPSNLNSHSAYSNLVSWWQLGENSSFDGNDWLFADEKGSNNGESINMTISDLVNGVGTTANGVSSGMSEGSLVGDAPYSTANAISSGMAVTARGTDVP